MDNSCEGGALGDWSVARRAIAPFRPSLRLAVRAPRSREVSFVDGARLSKRFSTQPSKPLAGLELFATRGTPCGGRAQPETHANGNVGMASGLVPGRVWFLTHAG